MTWISPIKNRFTLAPIPEPGTYAMMALGLLVIGSQLRRRRAA
jgi:hypothetical protein